MAPGACRTGPLYPTLPPSCDETAEPIHTLKWEVRGRSHRKFQFGVGSSLSLTKKKKKNVLILVDDAPR